VLRLRKTGFAAILAAGIACVALAGGCSKKDVNQEVVAGVNGEDLTVLELREALGAPGGIFSFSNMTTEEKRQAVEELVRIRLLEQHGRSLGLDRTEAFREAVRGNETGVIINALLRKEAREKLILDEKEVRTLAGQIRNERPGVSEPESMVWAVRAVIDRQNRKIQSDLVIAAKKETAAAVDNAALDRIGKGEVLPDDAVLASAGEERIRYSDVKKVIREMPVLPIREGMQSGEATRALVSRILDQQLVVRAMLAYAKAKGVEGSEWYRASRRNMERVVIANLMFDNVTETVLPATDEEITAEYGTQVRLMEEGKAQAKARAEAMAAAAAKAKGTKDEDKMREAAGEAKAFAEERAARSAPPLELVKGKLREFVQEKKRRAAFETFLGELRKKGKVTVNDAVLSKV